MITTDNVTGEQLSITDIQFTNQNTFSMIVNQDIALNGARTTTPPENLEPTTSAEQSMSYNGVNYPLTNGLEEASRFRTDQGDTHSATTISMADDEFRPFTIV